MKTDTDTLEVVASVARIEQNVRLSGSEQGQKPERFVIPAKEEGEREGVNALTFVSPLAYKVIIHLQDKRVTYDMIHNMDQNLRVTKGLYMIKYIPKTDKRRKKGRPWMIGQDLIHMGIYISGWRHWNYLCDRIPELDWLRRNSTLTKGMFDFAAMQPGMSFWFTVQWVEYAEKIKAQPGPEFGSKQGPESTPYSVYKCSADEYRKHYKDKCATLRVLGDVLKEVQEVEEMPSVQEEMLENSGEIGMTREQYIKGRGGNHQPKDPVTGRFLKKSQKED